MNDEEILGPCHKCQGPAFAEVSSGYPDHVWRLWCRTCLRENRQMWVSIAEGHATVRPPEMPR